MLANATGPSFRTSLPGKRDPESRTVVHTSRSFWIPARGRYSALAGMTKYVTASFAGMTKNPKSLDNRHPRKPESRQYVPWHSAVMPANATGPSFRTSLLSKRDPESRKAVYKSPWFWIPARGRYSALAGMTKYVTASFAGMTRGEITPSQTSAYAP